MKRIRQGPWPAGKVSASGFWPAGWPASGCWSDEPWWFVSHTCFLSHLCLYVTCLFLLRFPMCPHVSCTHMFILPCCLVPICFTLDFLTCIYKPRISCMFLQFVYWLWLALYSCSTQVLVFNTSGIPLWKLPSTLKPLPLDFACIWNYFQGTSWLYTIWKPPRSTQYLLVYVRL